MKEIKKTEAWYKKKKIDPPIIPLIKLLHKNGFDTRNCCGHMPTPWVGMDWEKDSDFKRLYDLLIKNGYKNFCISGQWNTVDKWTYKSASKKELNLRFYFGKQPLIDLSMIKKERRSK